MLDVCCSWHVLIKCNHMRECCCTDIRCREPCWHAQLKQHVYTETDYHLLDSNLYQAIPLHIGRYDHYFDINSCFYRLRFGSNWSLNTMQLHLIMLPVNSHYFNYFFQSKMFVHFWHYQMSKMIKTLLRASPNYLWPLQSLVPLSQRLLKINRMSQPNKHGTNMNCQYQYLLKGGRSYVNTVLQDTGSETQCSELLQNTEKDSGQWCCIWNVPNTVTQCLQGACLTISDTLMHLCFGNFLEVVSLFDI